MIEGFENETRKLNGIEKYWMHYLFETFYNNLNIRENGKSWINKTCNRIENWRIGRNSLPVESRMRKIIHAIRTLIIEKTARRVLNQEDMDYLPESYKRLFWIDANSKGYMPTQNKEQIEKHIKSLKERVLQIQQCVISAEEVLEAIRKLEKYKMLRRGNGLK